MNLNFFFSNSLYLLAYKSTVIYQQSYSTTNLFIHHPQRHYQYQSWSSTRPQPRYRASQSSPWPDCQIAV
ncbi:hypothetical protein E4U35_007617 [Claviceps purpurea]|nr:hypothetical protein E4U35_007617 [Claviceps purpurea]